MTRSRAAWRAMLLLGAAWAVAGSPALAAASPDASEPPAAFRPPIGRPMLLSRTLWRDLADGKQIVATRRYRVRFLADGLGWRVEGELVASEIDAPEILRPLAEIERQRPDDGLFPIALDSHGRIAERDATVLAGGPTQGGEAVERAVALALSQLERQPRPPAEAADVRAFLQRIQTLAAAAVTTSWPSSLFLPGGEAVREEQRFALPNGSEGVLTSEVTSAASPSLATMASCERRVITEIAGDRRVTRELWTLEPVTDLAAR